MKITASVVDDYILAQQQKGLKPATINRRTQPLRQAFRLAIRNGQLLSAPHIRHLSEDGNTRRGFFEEPQFRELRTECLSLALGCPLAHAEAPGQAEGRQLLARYQSNVSSRL